jgi:hypothetical protein
MDEDSLDNAIKKLKEELQNHRILIDNSELENSINNSLKKINYDSEGKVIPSSVDSRVRALAIMIAGRKQCEKLLSIPLKESQENYFKLLEMYFSKLFEEMRKYNVYPSQVASDMASRKNIVEAFKLDSKAFFEEIKKFWEYYSPIINAHISNLKGLKTSFGGDLFPSESHNIVHTVGLYADTIILPDPLLRVFGLFGFLSHEKVVYYLTKHALNVLQYKELALADVDPPILIIAPDEFYMNPKNAEIVLEISKSYVFEHLNTLFGTTISSEEEMNDFLKGIQSIDNLKHLMKNPERLLFDIDQMQEPLEVQIDNWMKEINANSEFFKNMSTGELLQFNFLSRMRQANDTVLRGIQFDASPLMDAPTSWQYLIWKYEYDLRRTGTTDKKIKELLVNNALTSINAPLIGNLTDKALIKLRKEKALQELRDLLTKNIHEINEASEENFAEVTNQVISNLSNAFEEHRKYIGDLRNRNKKFYEYDILPLLIIGGLSIAAAFTTNSALSTIIEDSKVIFGGSVLNMLGKGIPLVKENRKIEKSPVSILLKYSKQ